MWRSISIANAPKSYARVKYLILNIVFGGLWGVLGTCRAWRWAHTTLVLKIYCFSSHWHVARLPLNCVKRCWTMQANVGTLSNAKVEINWKTWTPLLPCTSSFTPPTLWSSSYGFVMMTSSIMSMETRSTYWWHVVPNIWPVKIRTNIAMQEIPKGYTPSSSWTPRVNFSFFLSCCLSKLHHKSGSKFYQFFS